MTSPQHWRAHQTEYWRAHQTEYWDRVAPKYDSLYSTAWSKAENQQVIEQLRQLQCLRTNSSVLDLGCGTGLGYELCSQAVTNDLEYFGLDISAEMIEICNQKWTGGQFLVGTMSDLSAFKSETFDVVISLFSAFSYAEEPENVLKEAHRVLRPGGELFVSYLSRYSLRRIIRAKFNDIEYYSTRYSTHNLSVPAFVYSHREIKPILNEIGFTIKARYGQGLFSGVLEQLLLWKLDSSLAFFLPELCHLQNIYAKKGNL